MTRSRGALWCETLDRPGRGLQVEDVRRGAASDPLPDPEHSRAPGAEEDAAVENSEWVRAHGLL